MKKIVCDKCGVELDTNNYEMSINGNHLWDLCFSCYSDLIKLVRGEV